ncbi:hypothetical protein ACLOJK_016806 [Asimina triloba]
MASLHSSDLQKIFQTIDHDGNGQVDVQELSWLLHRIGVSTSPEELESIVGGRSLELQDFIFFYESISGDEEEAKVVEEAFKVFDQNNDGFITSGELQSVLTSLGLWEETRSDCKRMISEFDMDLDGRLDFSEFKTMMLLTMG